MGRDITPEDAVTHHQISTQHEHMTESDGSDTGEIRFRLKKGDGTAYIRTEAGNTPRWQQSHYHTLVKETYIVQRGWTVLASVSDNGIVRFRRYEEGDIFSSPEGTIHNVYTGPQCVLHTVKHGAVSRDDRTTDASTREFDAYLRSTESQHALQLALESGEGTTEWKDVKSRQ